MSECEVYVTQWADVGMVAVILLPFVGLLALMIWRMTSE